MGPSNPVQRARGHPPAGRRAARRPAQQGRRRSSTSACNRAAKPGSANCSAWARSTAGSHGWASAAASPARKRAGSGASTYSPVTPSTTVSRKPPARSVSARPAEDRGLQRGEAEVLVARRDQDAGVRVDPAQLGVGEAGQEAHVAPASWRRSASRSGPGADDHEPVLGAAHGIDDDVDVLVRQQPRDHEVVPAGARPVRQLGHGLAGAASASMRAARGGRSASMP